jgi:RNA polymerase sigma-70 factor (ECF subfamily)
MRARTATLSKPSPLTADTALVERALASDQAAFEELVARHSPRLGRLVSRMVEGAAEREEALQNAWISAWRNLPTFEGRSQFGSWIYRVTANESLMLLRQRRRRPDIPASNVDDLTRTEANTIPFCSRGCWVERPDEAMQRTELRALLQRTVENLAPMLRQAFMLRYVDGLSIKETARLLRVGEPTVKTRLHRACMALRKAIHRSAVDVSICSGKRAVRRKTAAERRSATID